MSGGLCRPAIVRVPSPAGGPSIVRVPAPALPSVVRREVPGIPGPAGPVGPDGGGFGTIDYSDLDAVELDGDGAVVSGSPLLMAADRWTRVIRTTAPSASNTNLPSGPWAGFAFWDGTLLRARARGDGYLFKFAFRVRPSQRAGSVRFAVRPNGNPKLDFGPDATVLTVDGGEVETGSRTFFQQVRPSFEQSGAEIHVYATSGGELLEFSPEVTPLLYKR